MTATEELLAQVTSPRGNDAGRVRALEDQELAALRHVLLANERTQLRKILHRLDDPATRASEVAAVLPAAVALRGADGAAVAASFAPLVRESLAGVLQERPDLLVKAMRGAVGGLLRAPWRALGAQARAWRKQRQVRRGPAQLEQLYLLRRETGELLEQRVRPMEDGEEATEESRSVASMVTYLLAFLKNPEQLARYAALGQLRIEQQTYGVCAGASVVLLSVIRGGVGEEKVLTQSQELLMAIDETVAGNPAVVGPLLPDLGQKNETPAHPL